MRFSLLSPLIRFALGSIIYCYAVKYFWSREHPTETDVAKVFIGYHHDACSTIAIENWTEEMSDENVDHMREVQLFYYSIKFNIDELLLRMLFNDWYVNANIIFMTGTFSVFIYISKAHNFNSFKGFNIFKPLYFSQLN